MKKLVNNVIPEVIPLHVLNTLKEKYYCPIDHRYTIEDNECIEVGEKKVTIKSARKKMPVSFGENIRKVNILQRKIREKFPQLSRSEARQRAFKVLKGEEKLEL